MTSAPTPTTTRPAGGDGGRAIIEVVFLAVLLLIPTVYILIGVIRLQAATLAVAQSARDVGRLIETSPRLPSNDEALAVARVALDDQHIGSDGLRIVTTGRGGSCADATATAFSRQPGTDYDVCVIVAIDLPGVPTAVTGSRNTVTGVYTVHIDDLREGR
jgi:hypothetical protein